MLKFCLVSILLFCFVNLNLSQNEDKINLINFHVERNFMGLNNKIPGVGISIIQGEDVFLERGYGYKSIERNESVDENTLFLIGSVSKSFVGLLTAQKLKEIFSEFGEIVLEMPIASLLPSTDKFILSDRFRTESASFRDLLSHRICIEGHMIGGVFGSYENDEDIVERFKYASESCLFRSGSFYNNHMYTLATHYLGKIAESSYSALLDEFFEKLGMNSSSHVKEEDDYESMNNLSDSYYEIDGNLHKLTKNLIKRNIVFVGSGGIISTPKDMGNYLKFLINNGIINGIEIIPKEILDWATVAAISIPFDSYKNKNPNSFVDGDTGYGLGFFSGIYRDETIINHSGFFNGHTSRLTIYKNSKIGVYTVSNGPVQIDHRELHNNIYDIITDQFTADENDQITINKNIRRNSNLELFTLSPENPFKPLNIKPQNISRKLVIEEIVGQFENPIQGKLEISLKNNELRFTFGEWGRGTLLETDEPNLYYLNLNQDIIGDLLATFGQLPPMSLMAIDENTLRLNVIEDKMDFKRCIQLPEKIWDPESCAPEEYELKFNCPESTEKTNQGTRMFNPPAYFAFILILIGQLAGNL